ncbi:hypothetical protein OR16_04322 [Cupriavidus basilensis OR16]|uniref:Uncharacterized protein n=1 Tax=Cupriavidus basilensis OR16 TaxID=1127483 RepID=H1RZV8_9BURK|nr:hypothetical protein [Cupriavidus basilensis]EHP44174.1 hypothetical protein OR16_04322 [Cupriavidus basilensis OR16]
MNKPGGVSFCIFHCLFNPDGSIVHHAHSFDEELYALMPHLYAICVAAGGKALPRRRIVGCFFMRTTHHHEDAAFNEAIDAVCEIVPQFTAVSRSTRSYLPARLGIKGSKPPSELQMLDVALTQYVKWSDEGFA